MKKIIRISGGLGNQMFQYAFFLSLKKQFETQVDTSWYNYNDDHNGLELMKWFPVSFPVAPVEMCEKYGCCKHDVFHKIYYKLLPKNTYYRQGDKESITYDENVYNEKYVYIDGYFQSEKYFDECQNEIRKTFKFSVQNLSEDNKSLLSEIEKHNTVSIHIRRGDYINLSKYKGICDYEYYRKAIRYISDRVDNPRFIVFSNDMKWCRRNFDNKYIYVDWNQGKDSYIDMYLMSKCKHNIIANSSFSWWGAWLNTHGEKSITIAPKKWLNTVDESEMDIIPDRWVKV